MQDLGSEVPLRLSTAEGSDIDVTAVLDEAGQAWLKSAMAGKAALEVQLRPSEEDDVRAHAVDGGVLVRVTIGGGEDDDVEGHAMSLHFPSMEAARDFERRLLATGLIAGTVAVSIIGVGVTSQSHTGIGSITAPLAGDAPTVQYAPAARDTDRGDLSAPAPFTIQTGSGEHIGLSEAAAGAAATTAPRSGDHVGLTESGTRVDLGTTVAGSRTVTTDHVGGYMTAAGAAASTSAATPEHIGLTEAAAAASSATDPRANDTVGGYMTAAGAAASSATDPRANDTVGGYMTAAGATASSATDPRAGDTVGGYMTAAGAAAASGSATDEHVGLSEMATGAGAAAEAPQYAPAVRDTDRGDLGTPAATDDDPAPRGPHPL